MSAKYYYMKKGDTIKKGDERLYHDGKYDKVTSVMYGQKVGPCIFQTEPRRTLTQKNKKPD
jgi:hypothetical protein